MNDNKDSLILYFKTQDNTTNIKLERTKKPYTFGQNYSNYNIAISFLNSLGSPILTINCTERELLTNIENINQFIYNQYNVYSDVLHFTCSADMKSYFWYISILSFLGESPSEDDDRLQISVYENYMNQNILRYYFETDYDELSNFMFVLYSMIDDLPYLYNMINDSMIMELYELGFE